MAEDGGDKAGHGSKPAASVESAGGRLRFTVQLEPGETTIVSWKKLVKEYNSGNLTEAGPPVSGPSTEAQNQPVSQPPPPLHSMTSSSSKQPMANEDKDSQAHQVGSNRLNNVIERIERMYAGNGSSEDEDFILDDVPDDDEYDTEDSFIDDSELDDYFKVDNSPTKHDGFFINRGKLERIEPATSNQQPKKRRHKDLAKGHGGSDDGHNANKHVKIGAQDGKASSLSKSQSHRMGVTNLKGKDVQFHASPVSDYEALLNNSDQQHRGKGGLLERSDLNVPGGSLETTKVTLTPRKEGSGFRPKSAELDKAIKELEKIVAELRPPSSEVKDPDNSSQAIKRRVPPEIKLMLARVARLSEDTYGMIPKDLLNHLMSIVGHLMQLRTLKRNLKALADLELSAKLEKDDRVQKMKQEIEEMVNLRIPFIKFKTKQQTANSDDVQESGPAEKEVFKPKFSLDVALENKMCDLYDLYVERGEEDSSRPVRRLYEELAALWPNAVMDAEGIKHAIYKAKEKRMSLCSQRMDQEKIKKKKVVASEAKDTIQKEAINVTKSLHIHDKSSNSRNHGSTLAKKPVLSALMSPPSACPPFAFAKDSNLDKRKPEKPKGSSSCNPIDARPMAILPKKKVKRQPNTKVDETQFQLEKLVVSQTEEKHKQHKHVATPLDKSSPPPGPPSGCIYLS